MTDDEFTAQWNDLEALAASISTAKVLPGAGRELDALVAETLFGWQWYDVPEAQLRCFRPPGRLQYGAVAMGDQVKYSGILPDYSTDISDAWNVVLEMERRGHIIRLEHSPDLDRPWSCGFGLPGAWADGTTAPLAICRAALKAMEEANE